jgi:hypothetical protein
MLSVDGFVVFIRAYAITSAFVACRVPKVTSESERCTKYFFILLLTHDDKQNTSIWIHREGTVQ